MRNTPCKNCQRRFLGCQTEENCEDYADFIRDLRARKAYCYPKPADIYVAEGNRKKKAKKNK